MKSIYKRIFGSVLLILFAIKFQYGNSSISQLSRTTWKEQLEYIKNNPYKKNEGDLSHLNLINYTYKGIIKTATEKDQIIDSLLSYDSPVVLHLPPIISTNTIVMGDSCVIQEISFPKFDIVTIRTLMDIAENIGEKNPVIQMKQQLGKLIQVGFEYLELEWNYKGDKLHSLCIVSNEYGGIVYEPLGGIITIGTKITSQKTTKF